MFLDALAGQFAARPEEIGAIADDRRISYAEMDTAIGSLADWLGRAGIAPGDTVGLTVRDEYRHLIAALALIRMGCIQVTLPSHEPVEHRQAIAERTKAVVVLAEDQGAGVPTLPAIVPDFAYRSRIDGAFGLPADRGGKVCMYLTSSGTTGRIKIVPVTGDQLFHQAQTWQWPAQRDVFYRPTLIEFNNSKRQRLYNLIWATTNVFADARRFGIAETCRRWRVTRLNVSAAQARTLAGQAAADRSLPATCHVRLGGSEINAPLRKMVAESLTPNLHVTYATSEFGSIATAGPEHHRRDGETVGLVHPGVRLEIVDENDMPLPANTLGRIRVGTPGMTTGYLDDEAATATAFRDGWFYPGDMGHRSEDGLLFLDGRSDDMMLLASINIFPAEIEHAMEALPGVVECAAFSMKSASFGDVPMLAAVVTGPIRAPDMLAYARSRLGLRAPRKIFLVDSLPRNRGGKIDRHALRARFAIPSIPEPTS